MQAPGNASQGLAHTGGAYDAPETADEVTRRTFMANATLAIGGIIGVVLAIPIIGSLLPGRSTSQGNWSPLTPAELEQLQKATDKPVKLAFTMTYQDGYLPPEQSDEYVWGIKVDPSKFQAARPDIFTGSGGAADVPFTVVNMGFVIFSPVCPHLGCRYNWSDDANRFICPCHGSQYNFEGAHLAGPAPRGLDPLPFRDQSGKAEVTWIQFQPNTPARIVISYSP
jgi:menaquinol-cytochrome c reductase iron-sulfur subunit